MPFPPPIEFRASTTFTLLVDDDSPLARINYHLDWARVIGPVCVLDDWYLDEGNLDSPDNEPWFLIFGEYHSIPRFLIVNSDYLYLPVASAEQSNRNNPSNFYLRHPDGYSELIAWVHGNGTKVQETYDWSGFSTLDLEVVKAAITTYLTPDIELAKD